MINLSSHGEYLKERTQFEETLNHYRKLEQLSDDFSEKLFSQLTVHVKSYYISKCRLVKIAAIGKQNKQWYVRFGNNQLSDLAPTKPELFKTRKEAFEYGAGMVKAIMGKTVSPSLQNYNHTVASFKDTPLTIYRDRESQRIFWQLQLAPTESFPQSVWLFDHQISCLKCKTLKQAVDIFIEYYKNNNEVWYDWLTLET